MANIIQIKRRLPDSILGAGAPGSLAGGELAFNEIDSVLYYGASAGVIPIAGPGMFVDRTTDQTIGGIKTFLNTLSAKSDIECDGNVDANSYSINGTNIIDSGRNAGFVNLSASGDLTVSGNLTVFGDSTVIETIVTTTSSFNINNAGSGPALEVTQSGDEAIAAFYDDADCALYIDGKTATPGFVGIGTCAPTEKLTVVGSVSTTEFVHVKGTKISESFPGLLGIGASSSAFPDLYIGNNGGYNTQITNYWPGADLSLRTDAGRVIISGLSIQPTFYVDASDSTFVGNISATGTLIVDSDATITDLVTVKTADFGVSTGGAVISDATNKRLRVDDRVGGWNVDYTANGIDSQVNPAGFTITTMVDGGAGIKFTPAVGSHTNVTSGDLNVLLGNLVGNGTNSLSAWIIDGGYV